MVKCRDFVHFVINCNNPPFDIEPSERRYMISLCSPRFVGNLEYHSALRQSLSDHARDIFDYLANYKLPECFIGDPSIVPVTKVMADLKIRSLPQPLRFCRYMCSGSSKYTLTVTNGVIPFTSSGLFDAYASFCRDPPFSKSDNEYSSSIGLSRFLLELGKAIEHSPGGGVWRPNLLHLYIVETINYPEFRLDEEDEFSRILR